MTSWRPQLLWVPMGGILGTVAGALTGFATLATSFFVAYTRVSDGSLVSDILGVALVGGIVGGLIGAGTGIVVGVPFAFLVGRHLPRPTARRRALVLGVVLPPLALLATTAVLFGGPVTVESLLATPSICSAVLGGPLAWWAAGLDDRDRGRAAQS